MALSSVPYEEGSLAKRLWMRSQREVSFSSFSPFVAALAAGNLDIKCFQEYVQQDKHFLHAYDRAYEIAEDCADDVNAKAGIHQLRMAVLEELKMHGLFCTEWGVDSTTKIDPTHATIKYMDFLLSTALGKVGEGMRLGEIDTPLVKTKIAAYTIGAMTPCMRLYSFLGKMLQMSLGSDEDTHRYKKWIDNYASENFEASAEKIEQLLGKLSGSLAGEELEVIEKLYQRAMDLEAEFFCSQSLLQPVVIPLTLLLDQKQQLILFSNFDLTCSVVNSSTILAEIAILAAQNAADLTVPHDFNVRSSSLNLRNLWDVISRQYTEEYEQCIESILASDKASAFDYEALSERLVQLTCFEAKAYNRVLKSGLLHGMRLDDIKRAGECLNLQDGGCRDFFETFVSKREKLGTSLACHLFSYCWCADLIRSAFSSDCLNVLNIHTNELEYEDSVTTGEVTRRIVSPIDKVKTFRNILSSHGTKNDYLSMYIGDSVGDLLCLLEADIGIVIGSSASLRRVGERFGITFVPLFAGVVAKQKEIVEEIPGVWRAGQSGVLYTVSNWSEIQAFTFGHDMLSQTFWKEKHMSDSNDVRP